MNFQEAAKSANHAQRNWLDEPIPESDVTELINVATTMPTKQNVPVYKLIVSTNKEFNSFVYKNAVDEIHEQNKKYDHGGEFIRNSMVLAPLLLIYVIQFSTNVDDPWWKKGRHITIEDANMGTGISSGAVALAANAKGYKTGFCTCLKADAILHELKKRYKISTGNKKCLNMLALGIGKPNPGIDHNVVIRPEDNEQFYIRTHLNENECLIVK